MKQCHTVRLKERNTVAKKNKRKKRSCYPEREKKQRDELFVLMCDSDILVY